MTRLVIVSLVATAAALTLGACADNPSMQEGRAKVRAGIGDAVTAPLEDLNLKRHEIPPILTRAETNPYDLAKMDSCESIAADVGALDDALGPDLDEPPPPLSKDQKRGDQGAKTTLDVVRGASESVVPFRYWVRRLTGAERHSQAVQKAIKAGSERRAYLKGVGMRKNCAPPAAPSWFKPDPQLVAAKPRPKRRKLETAPGSSPGA
jgi:hypothetical protein